MAEILVVGGAGFIGSHVTDALVGAGHVVRVLTRDPERAAADWPGAARVQLIPGNFLDTHTLMDAMDGSAIVLHFASTTNPASSVDRIADDLRDNVLGGVGLLDVAVQTGVERVLFASTGGAIYGAYPGRPLRETDPAMPVSPYAISKLAMEGYLRFYRARHGLESLALRISNPYGPRQDPGTGQGVIAAFIDRARRNESVTIFGDGSMTRDYIHIDDVARIIATIADRDAPHPVVNVGSGVGTSVNELRAMVANATGCDLQADYRPARPSDIPAVILDPSLLESTYGLRAEIPLTEGIWRTVAALSGSEA